MQPVIIAADLAEAFGMLIAADFITGAIHWAEDTWTAPGKTHKWAHSSERPWPVRALQRLGLMQSRGHHGVHHSAPYAVRFCPMTDYLNPVLDRLRFWRTVERALVAGSATLQRCTPARAGY